MPDIDFVRADADRLEKVARRCADDESRPLLLALAARDDFNGAWLALDQGTPIAAAVVACLEDERFVSALFVEPSFRREGVARELLARAGGDAAETRRGAIVDLSQPAAVAFALRAGLALQTPIVAVAGAIPADDELLRLAGGMQHFGVGTMDPIAQSYALDGIDRQTRGSARPEDHRQLFDGARGTAFFSDDELVGYAYVWPSGRIGPLACVAASYVAPFLAYAMASARREFGATWCTALVPGTNARALRTALGAGLTVQRSYAYASEASPAQLDCYVGGPPVAW
ncbi:MAG TPA: GNAT family N-acetyltransferase [Candidatus Baltobacteraceae bacterium]